MIGIPALAPNGRRYRLHRTTSPSRGYVYAFGHRVYGTVKLADTGLVYDFSPIGKWAFILAATNVGVEAAIANVS